jgi:D-3-phosphoglycerate dehydrogenase
MQEKFKIVNENTEENSMVYVLNQKDTDSIMPMWYSRYYVFPRKVNASSSAITWKIRTDKNVKDLGELGLTAEGLSKNLYEAQSHMCEGDWEIRGAKKAFELLGKKVGFIGLGAIGREALNICKGIGMNAAGYDPYLGKAAIEGLGAEYYEDYKEMLKECDIISVHVPLLPSTKNMITLEELKTMKNTALLVNCARGGIVKEDDLIEAINTGMIAGAGLDVFEEEPPKVGSPVLTAKNIIVSPHSAAQTREAVINMATMCVKGCLAVISGEKWPYVANPEAYNHEKWR